MKKILATLAFFYIEAFALDTPDSSFSYLKFDSQNGKDVFEQVKRKYKTDSSLYYSYIKDLEFDFIEDLKGLYQYGILGEKAGIQMYFSSVIKSSKANEYIVDGKSKAGKNIVSFSGTITILSIEVSNEIDCDSKDFKAKAKYSFLEDAGNKFSGEFKGILEYRSGMCGFFSDVFFKGSWTDYKTKKSKVCNFNKPSGEAADFEEPEIEI